MPKYTALSILRDRPGLSNAQLARRTYVAPQSMNEVLIALEADGLIVRSPAAHHGRVVETVLSERGHEVLAACDRAVGHMENAMLADLDEAEREQLFQALIELRAPARLALSPRQATEHRGGAVRSGSRVRLQTSGRLIQSRADRPARREVWWELPED